MADTPQPLSDAYRAGSAAFKAGQSEANNPLSGSPPNRITLPSGLTIEPGELGREWLRGFKQARKEARFEATIEARRRARRTAKGLKFERLVQTWDANLKRAFIRSVYNLRDQAQVEQIARMIQAGDIEGAIRAVGLDPVAFGTWHQSFAGAFQAGGEATAAAIPAVRAADGMKVTVRFDLRNPQAEQWLRQYSSGKVTEIFDDQRRMVRRFLTESMARGENPRTAALKLAGKIGKSGYREGGILGLTETQSQWVRNYADELQSDNPAQALTRKLRDRRFDRRVIAAAEGTGEPLTADEIGNMVRAYSNRALRLRAESISRTEAMTALHQAQSEALDQATLTGVIPKDALSKTWRTARDDRVRDSHAAMDGQTVGMDELFTTGAGNQLEYPGDPSGPAEEIINCRCYMEPNVDFLRGIQ